MVRSIRGFQNKRSNVLTKVVIIILSLLMMLLAFPKPVFALEINPFTEKWGKDLSNYPNVDESFTTLVMPVTADVVGDSWHEIFLSLGYDHSQGDEGIVFCLDGHTGNVLWSYFSSNFGSHTCLELYDVDSDGKLELLATGYHHVVMFNAEDGSILWEFTRPNNRQDKPSVILEEDGVVYVFTCSHRGDNGIGLQKRFGINGTLVKEITGPLHPCHGGLSAEDLDGDGDFELIVTDRSSGLGVQCYDTDLNLLWYHLVSCSSHLANIIDVNNDGIFDVVVMKQGDGSAGICVVDGSTGAPMTGKWSMNLGLWAHYTPAIYDIDQDGHLELITARDISGAKASVWDLETWSLDAELWRHDGQYGLCKPPVVANVIGNGDMEMVFCTHAGFDVFDKNYDLIAYHNDGYDGRADRMVIQDIDNDGLNEIVAVMHEPGTGSNTYAFVQCLDTPGTAPTPHARTENFLYSLRRNGVSVYDPSSGGQGSQNDPPISNDDFYNAYKNSTINVSALGVLDNDEDDDGPEDLTAVLVSNVSNGILTLNADGAFVYTPDLDFIGDDTFTYKAYDGQNYSTVSTVIVNVSAFDDTTSPKISDEGIVWSDPLDTQDTLGWENFTCVVSDNIAVNTVMVEIVYPDSTKSSISMTKIDGTDKYYYNTSLSQFGNYSYTIWVNDSNGNENTSRGYDFSLSPNWDVNNDGRCTVLDYMLISSHYGQSGIPGWIREDVDNNGQIQIFDMVFLSDYYGESWWMEDMTRLKKLSICYKTSINQLANQQFIAQHFDMLDCGRSVYTATTNIKSLNPNIIILGYYDSILMQPYYGDWGYVDQFEEWFVHDKNGSRIRSSNYGGYLMNPAPNLTPNDPYHSWSDYFAQKSHQLLQDNTQYDGIFADDVTLYLLTEVWTAPLADFEDGVLSNWSTWIMQYIQNLQTTIGNKMVMPNVWKYTQVCEEITGVHFWEHFVHGRVHDITQPGYGEGYTLYAINTLHEQAEKGNTIAVLSGTKNADSNPELARKYMLFTMVCFLFAVEDMDNSYYAWNFFGDDASNGYYPEMDHRFGQPIGEYYNIQGSIYARQFENATVVANISPSTIYTIVIDGNSYEIGSRSGLIIEK